MTPTGARTPTAMMPMGGSCPTWWIVSTRWATTTTCWAGWAACRTRCPPSMQLARAAPARSTCRTPTTRPSWHPGQQRLPAGASDEERSQDVLSGGHLGHHHPEVPVRQAWAGDHRTVVVGLAYQLERDDGAADVSASDLLQRCRPGDNHHHQHQPQRAGLHDHHGL